MVEDVIEDLSEKVVLINRQGYKIIFQNKEELYNILISLPGYNFTYKEYLQLFENDDTFLCEMYKDSSLLENCTENINDKYYCVWLHQLKMMSLYKYTEKGNKFIKNIVLHADINTIIKYYDKTKYNI